MTDEEKLLVDESLEMDGRGRVRTFLLAPGGIVTNYAPFKKYFREHPYTKERADCASFKKYFREHPYTKERADCATNLPVGAPKQGGRS